ncbi:MAG: type II toxin-antitoxin system RelE/ParE family toxin [Arcobacteraceae bacterium]
MEWKINYYSQNNKSPVKKCLMKLAMSQKLKYLKKKLFVMLHGFQKKTQATPRKEIDIAIKRMKELTNG